MYYIIYAFLYVVSLLPFFILYGISDVVCFFMYRVFRYRKSLVIHNISIAFPTKTKKERELIAKQFYKNFTDNFIETLKLISMSPAEFDKRISVNMDACNALAASGKNIQFNSGHQMNWEYASLAISKHLQLPWLAVYKKISSPPMEKLVLKIRTKFGATMVAIEEYAARMPALMKQQYALGLIADQNPTEAKTAYWLNFFNRPAPFLTGTDKGPRRNKTAVVFVNIFKIKRGYYTLELKIITDDGSRFKEGELTRMYRDFLEENIERQPASYLWSHRRWKHQINSGHLKKWIDNVPVPAL